MSLISITAMASAIFLLAVTPGPGVFATMARAMASGFKHSAVVAAGIVTGDLIFLLFAVFGLSAIAENLFMIFLIIKYAGAGYLIFLGFRLWLEKPQDIEIKGVKESSFKSNFLTGLFITLGNPKVILFYLSFLPTFVDLKSLTSMDVIILALTISIVLGSTLLSYGYAASNAKKLFKSRKSQKKMNRSAGGVMMLTGSFLAAKA